MLVEGNLETYGERGRREIRKRKKVQPGKQILRIVRGYRKSKVESTLKEVLSKETEGAQIQSKGTMSEGLVGHTGGSVGSET